MSNFLDGFLEEEEKTEEIKPVEALTVIVKTSTDIDRQPEAFNPSDFEVNIAYAAKLLRDKGRFVGFECRACLDTKNVYIQHDGYTSIAYKGEGNEVKPVKCFCGKELDNLPY